MNRVSGIFWRYQRDDSGQDLIEYAMIIAVLGLGAMAIMRNFAGSIATTLTGIGSKLTSSV